SVGYDEKTRTLEVEMSNGQVFQYGGVYPEVYPRFMAAPNPTPFFDDKKTEEYFAKRVLHYKLMHKNAFFGGSRAAPRPGFIARFDGPASRTGGDRGSRSCAAANHQR